MYYKKVSVKYLVVHFNVVELGNEHLVYFCVIARLIELFELSHMNGERHGVSRVL